jgi:threonylcarbamoyladenosine tRNA methylthiotransferase MtaB
MKVSLLTLGCRVNQSESSIIEGSLKENGVTIVSLNDKPDFCVVNTCSVTSKGDYNSRQLIRRAARSGAKVIVTGCYSQLRTDDVRCMMGVHKVVDNRSKLDIVGIIAGSNADISRACHSRCRPYLKIQDGCDFRCSYCIVPAARGRSRSISEDDVTDSVSAIVSQGYSEVVLTGIHLGSYGKDLMPKSSLKRILVRILRETRIRRIRLSSLEIMEVDDEFIEILAEDRLCKHLHLPLQSGSDSVLRAMKRGYSASYFSEKIELIASRIANISVGSDVIVGFPGELDEDFHATCNLVKSLPISYVHVFPFSCRPGTEASTKKGRVDEATIKKRAQFLAEISRLKKRAYLQRQLNTPLDVILEEPAGADAFIGTSGNYVKVRTSAQGHAKGSLVRVMPAGMTEDILDAVVVKSL